MERPYRTLIHPGEALDKLLGGLERDIMETMWSSGPSTVRDVLIALNQRRTPQRQLVYTTVMTVMTRLVEKRLLGRERVGKAHVYTAAVSQEEFLTRTSQQIAAAWLKISAMPRSPVSWTRSKASSPTDWQSFSSVSSSTSPNRTFAMLASVSIASILVTGWSTFQLLLAGAPALSVGRTWPTASCLLPTNDDFVPHLASYLFIAAMLVGLVSGSRVLLRQYLQTRQLLRACLASRASVRTRLAVLAERLGLESRLDLVSLTTPVAFCYGYLRPRAGKRWPGRAVDRRGA